MNKRIYEIKRSGASLSALQVGKVMMAKRWAESVFDSFEMKNGVIYPADEEIFSDKFLSKIPPYVKMLVMKPFDKVEYGDKLHPYGEKVLRKYYHDRPKDVEAVLRAVDDGMRFKMFGTPAIKLNVETAIKSKVNFVAIEYVDDDGVLRTAMNAYDPQWGHICVTIWEGPES